jgi:xylulokinase
MSNYFLGIDLGTTGTSIILMRDDGKVTDKGYAGYKLLNPSDGYAEQRPQDWWEQLCIVSKELIERNSHLAKDIACIGVDGQMHTQVYLDKNGCPLRNAITWMDQRSSKVVEEINGKEENRKFVFEHTSNFLNTTYTAPNIKWVQEHEPEIYSKTAKILLAKDYLKYMLTREMITDYSDGAGTMLFDVCSKTWSEEMFSFFGIDASLMPEIGESATVVGAVVKEASRATGIPEGTPVINGCADHAATSLGAGVVNPNQASAIIGTAGVLSVLSDKPMPDQYGGTSCWNYCLPGQWVNLGVMQTAGESLNWFRRAFDREAGPDIFDDYNRKIETIEDGSAGLVFLPYLMGERTPYWDSKARGVFFGISLNHTKYHFVKSIMEGVSFAFKNNLESLESLGISVNELRLLGGGSKSQEWRSILAAVLNRTISTVEAKETAALGSSILCGLALGMYNNPQEAANELVRIKETLYIEDLSMPYMKNYAIFKELYPSLKKLYQKL